MKSPNIGKRGKDVATIIKIKSQEEAIKFYAQEMFKILPSLTDAQQELAKGAYILKPIRKDGEIIDAKVYKSKPDNTALEDIFNRILGKVKEKMDITSGGEKLLDYEQINALLLRRAKTDSPSGKI